MKTRQRLAPATQIYKVVPLRNEIAEGATAFRQRARMAKWKAAIHATGALLLQILYRHVKVRLIPILNSFKRRTFWHGLPFEFKKGLVYPLISPDGVMPRNTLRQEFLRNTQSQLPLTRAAKSWLFRSNAAIIASSP